MKNNFIKVIITGLFLLVGQQSMATIATDTDFPAGSDYLAATQDVYFNDPVSEQLYQVNSILCFISKLRTDEFVNQGNYLALVDIRLCDSSNGEGSSNAAAMEEVLVSSTRVDEDSAQKTDMTIYTPSDNIDVVMEVRGGVDDANPFGRVTISYGGGNATGTLHTDGYNVEASYAISQSATTIFTSFVNANLASNTGSYKSFAGAGTFAFDATNLITVTDSASRCYDRTQEIENVFSYNLYRYNGDSEQATGTIISPSSFPFSYDNGAKFGLMGYDFVWTEDNSTQSITYPSPVTNLDNGISYTVVYSQDVGSTSSSVFNAAATSLTDTNDATLTIVAPIRLELTDVVTNDYRISVTQTISGYISSEFIYFNNGASLKDGVILTSGSNTYVVKANYVDVSYETTNIGNCGNLVVPATVTRPANRFVTPIGISSTDALEPSVINGELQ